MSNYSLLHDVVKVRQEELAREVELARIGREFRRYRKSTSLAKKLRAILAAKID